AACRPARASSAQDACVLERARAPATAAARARKGALARGNGIAGRTPRHVRARRADARGCTAAGEGTARALRPDLAVRVLVGTVLGVAAERGAGKGCVGLPRARPPRRRRGRAPPGTFDTRVARG